MPEYIFDTTVLSNLAAVGRLDLLERRYAGIAFTTVEVCDELRKGINAGYPHLAQVLDSVGAASAGGWLEVLVPQAPPEPQFRAEFDLVLDMGEAACLALALARGQVLVTDDLAARRIAKARGVAVTGTLGILIASVRDGTLALAEANALLAGMIEARYRSPVVRLDEFV